MANCPKCNDPIAPGETFCGKCGNSIPVQPAQTTPPTPSPATSPPTTPPPATPPTAAQPAAYTPKPGGKKTWLWVGIAVAAVVAILLVLWGAGLLGGSAAVANYVQNTQVDFQSVVDKLGQLDKALTYESSGDSEQDMEDMKAEIDNIQAAQSAISTAEANLNNQRVVSQVANLDGLLKSFYSAAKADLEYRYEIVNYFYTSEEIGDRLARAAGESNYESMTEIQEGFRQLKYALDEAIVELEDMDVPDALQTMHDSDIELLKRMSTILGDIVQEIQDYDEVGLLASFSQFESLMNEYETQTTEQYAETLEPEFAGLNEGLQNLLSTKDAIEDEYSNLKGKYNIK